MEKTLRSIELAPTRKITYAFITAAVDLFKKELKKKPVERLNYRKIGRELARKTGVKVATAQRALLNIFPRADLIKGIRIEELAERYLVAHPSIRDSEAIIRAQEMLRADPDMPISQIAQRIGLNPNRLSRMVRIALGRKLTTAEKGLRFMRSKGMPIGPKTSYRQYYSMDNVLIVAHALQRNIDPAGEIDTEKVVREVGVAIGPKKVRNIINIVFPAYLLKAKGIDYCVEQYRQWYDTKPKQRPEVRERQRKIAERRKSEEYALAERKRSKQVRKRIRAEKAVLRRIKLFLIKDDRIPNKPLFVQIALALLRGKSPVVIAASLNYPDKKEAEIAVVGVRKIMTQYFDTIRKAQDGRTLRQIIRGEKSKVEKRTTPLDDFLDLTRFSHTYKEGIVSPEIRDIARFASVKQIEGGRVRVISTEAIAMAAIKKVLGERIPLPPEQMPARNLDGKYIVKPPRGAAGRFVVRRTPRRI